MIQTGPDLSSDIKLGYVPKTWREVRVAFILKAGRPTHSTAKDFRPISLSSFLLKTMERIINLHVRNLLDEYNRIQHAYRKGKSMETALDEVVLEIEKNLFYKEFTLAAFLDVEGAFNNVRTESIKAALTELGVGTKTTKWIDEMLNSRVINSELGQSDVRKTVARGTPQGGVISPLLWLLVVNKILTILKSKRIKTVAYADDVVIIIGGKHLSTISNIMESALKELSSWAELNRLGANPTKTELVLFTKRRKTEKSYLTCTAVYIMTVAQAACRLLVAIPASVDSIAGGTFLLPGTLCRG